MKWWMKGRVPRSRMPKIKCTTQVYNRSDCMYRIAVDVSKAHHSRRSPIRAWFAPSMNRHASGSI